MNKIGLITIIHFFTLNAGAQELIGAAGGVHQSSSTQLSYSVGELVTPTLSGNVLLTQGFQQVDDLSIGLAEHTEHHISLYPNPCVADVYLEIEEPGYYELQIHDVHGRLILWQQSEFSQLSILDVSELNSGMYFLSIRTEISNEFQTIRFHKSR